jgi:general secretion pathway protein K
MDWKDLNDLHMLNGAEEDYYRSLERPYSCKDGPFDIIDELLLVRGVTPEILYGSKDSLEEIKFEGIEQYLTPWGNGKININTAPVEVLEIAFDAGTVENILTQRETEPFRSPISRGGIVTSSFFTVLSTGSTVDGKIKRTVKATLKKNVKDIEVIYWNDNVI